MKKRHKLAVICMSMITMLLMQTSIVASGVDNDKTNAKFPTVEQIMESYEVNREEAKIILQRMKNEEKQYQRDKISAQTVSPEEMKLEQKKEAMIAELKKQDQSGIGPQYGVWPGGWHYVITPMVSQETLYWCGPAAVQMALGARGFNVSQSTLASQIGTTEAAGSSGKNMANVLNSYIRGSYGSDWYLWREINENNLENLHYRVKLNITNDFDPILGIYQVDNGLYWLVGHQNIYLRHFVTVTGYKGVNGIDTIVYNDPVNGWGGKYAGVPASAAIPSYKISWLINGGSMIY